MVGNGNLGIIINIRSNDLNYARNSNTTVNTKTIK